MKQRITVEQLNELTPEQQVRLREWWKPHMYDVYYCSMIDPDDSFIEVIDRFTGNTYSDCLPLLSIGQCIELLDHFLSGEVGKYKLGYTNLMLDINISMHIANKNLIDALWQAVKEVL